MIEERRSLDSASAEEIGTLFSELFKLFSEPPINWEASTPMTAAAEEGVKQAIVMPSEISLGTAKQRRGRGHF